MKKKTREKREKKKGRKDRVCREWKHRVRGFFLKVKDRRRKRKERKEKIESEQVLTL